jgi:leucyl aminopeptidase
MIQCFTTKSSEAIPIYGITKDSIDSFVAEFPEFASWIENSNFKAKPRSLSIIKSEVGKLKAVLYGCSEGYESFWDGAFLADILPCHYTYTLQSNVIEHSHFYFSWGMATYKFDRYKESEKKFPNLVVLDENLAKQISSMVSSNFLVRDLINTPANDLTPETLAAVAKEIATKHKAKFEEISGPALEEGFPLIHAVGKASENKPRLTHFHWGNKKHPKIALVGKGITFDTGGLDIKPSPYMTLMKKDMGGAAHILGLANYIMAQNLPVQIDAYLPLAENSISSNAFRPGDVLKSRKGLTIEIGNTDAEGRLVLADAMTYAQEHKPDLLIDMATLTGAARIAVGVDISAMFGTESEHCNLLTALGEETYDPICQLPLWQPYANDLKSKIADINNDASSRYGGAIHAALFLQKFVDKDVPWLHFDIMAWNNKSQAGRPVGGEAMGLRALIRFIEEMYC